MNTSPAPALPTVEDLGLALAQRQLSLNYQPIIDMSSRKVRGFEALMRWEHPTLGKISPGIFIPLAEESGLIVEASKWALRESCRALKRLESRTGRDSNLYMSVNFTPRDFSEDTFIFDLYNIIAECDVLPGQVQLEISEGLLLNQGDNILSALTMCQKAGMKISIDDCATAQSDLSYLNKYPITSVKIDQLFIRKMLADADLARKIAWIITTAQMAGKVAIAEGVETDLEAQALIQAGCTQAQGYLYAKPLPEKDLPDFMLRAPV